MIHVFTSYMSRLTGTLFTSLYVYQKYHGKMLTGIKKNDTSKLRYPSLLAYITNKPECRNQIWPK